MTPVSARGPISPGTRSRESISSSNEAILTSYEMERIGFARRLVSTTYRAFTGSRRAAERSRDCFDCSGAAPCSLSSSNLLRCATPFFAPSQQTRDQLSCKRPLSEGRRWLDLRGYRLPWVSVRNGIGADNFTPLNLDRLAGTLYGDRGRALRALLVPKDSRCHVSHGGKN